MPSKTRHKKILGLRLIQRTEMWTLTVQGWVIAIALIASLTVFTITHLHPFLAVSSPIKADVLVVEGWAPDYALKKAIAELERGSYRQLITTGIPLERGYYLSEYKSFAQLAAATLNKLGVDKEKLIAVPAPNVIKDRTYASAVAVEQWISNSNSKVEGINLLSLGAHSRRSWLLFKEAFAPQIPVGVIAVEPKEYEPNKWWSSSEGVRVVMSETIAYIYARLVNWRG